VAGHQKRLEHDWQIAAWQTSHLLNMIRAAVGSKGEAITPDSLLKGAFKRTRSAPPPMAEE
jgi:hypothetical protein